MTKKFTIADEKFTIADEKFLKEYVTTLPIVFDTVHESHLMTGKELKEMGYVEHEGEVLVDDKNYMFPMPVMIARNHYRRMKTEWKKNGKEGVQKYIQEVVKIIQSKEAA